MKKSPLVGISLRNGSIAGLLSGVFLVVMYYTGPHPMLIDIPFMDFRTLLFGIFIFFSLKELRNLQDGVLYFAQGVLASLIFVTVAATVGAMCVLIFSKIEPDFVSDFIKQAMEWAKAKMAVLTEAKEKDQIAVMIKGLPSTNGKQLATQHFAQSLLIGFFISIILSVVLRKQPKT